MKNIIVLAGATGAGKTLFGNMLQQDGYCFHLEIGERCRANSQCQTTASCKIFDEVVMLRELQRDTEILQSPQKIHVVESWHVGNLAYAYLRNRDVFDEYCCRFKEQLQLFQPTVIHLKITPKILLKRSKERLESAQIDSYVGFFVQIADFVDSFSRQYGVRIFDVHSDISKEKVYAEIKDRLQGMAASIQ